MANFEEMLMLYAIDNIENNNLLNAPQIRNREMVTDPFTLSDQLQLTIVDLLTAIQQAFSSDH